MFVRFAHFSALLLWDSIHFKILIKLILVKEKRKIRLLVQMIQGQIKNHKVAGKLKKLGESKNNLLMRRVDVWGEIQFIEDKYL